MASPVTISSSGSTCIGGASNRENQDTFFTNPANGIYGVFDGHGAAGKLAADTVCEHLKDLSPRDIAEMPSGTIEAKMGRLFREIDIILADEIEHGPASGGTTASLLIIDKETGAATVVHVGDSDIWYYDESTVFSPHTDPASALGLSAGERITADHSATSLEEFNRMRNVIGARAPPVVEFERRDSFQAVRPVFISKDTGTGALMVLNPEGGYVHCSVDGSYAAYIIGPRGERLAMTRSLGDFNMKMNKHVISEPSVIALDPPMGGKTRTFVMASDGLWDVLTPTDVREILIDPFNHSASSAEEALMLAARAKSVQYFGMGGDNITVVVVKVVMAAAS